MKRLIFVLILFLLLIRINCQSADPYKNQNHSYNNIISTSLGVGPVYANFAINYETIIKERPDKIFTSTWLRVGGGFFQLWEDTGYWISTTAGMVNDKKKSSLEIRYGLVFMSYITTNDWIILPAGSVNYRYQKPGSKIILRSGLGFPEIIHFGLGYCL